ncbi:MAG: transcriptional repressor LexA [Candidatus Kerfeldbacteria bacterium]
MMDYSQRVKQLERFYNKRRRLPSYSEMLGLFGVKSKNAVAKVVDRLVLDGLVRRDDTGRLVPRRLAASVRVLGTVEAGFPSPAEEELADTISLDDFLIEKKESSFMLRVSGDSMAGAGIKPGDYVIVERGRTPQNGDIVVAEVDNEWTVKYFQKHRNKITLVPANTNFKPIRPKESLSVAGVVRSVIRKY